MTENEILLTMVAEECAEVAHVASKSLRFGLNNIPPYDYNKEAQATNAVRLVEEFNDLYAVMELLYHRGIIHALVDGKLISQKLAKIDKYMRMSEELGIVKNPNKPLFLGANFSPIQRHLVPYHGEKLEPGDCIENTAGVVLRYNHTSDSFNMICNEASTYLDEINLNLKWKKL